MNEDTPFKQALGVLVSAADVRRDQWARVARGERPDSAIDELWEVDQEEAEQMADMIARALKIVREESPST